MNNDRCMVEVNKDPTSFRGRYAPCGRWVKGSRVHADGVTRGVCGIHARARHLPIPWRGDRT